ncbi:DUF4282 domain-containing protein [Blastopirellula marina]|uniref:GYF domain-containing protein n=1 Tax=Blastopirellula marina TaxID=124 RepID=A0A2S8GKE3_9BACT|nr:DUF4282 domain-containing protein [Blastopirellula marina]PQO44917.1 hypothetical protein C5Y93_17665 [Blastopirellula marina]
MADQFFYKRDPNADEQGPIDAKTLKKLARSGELLPTSQIRREHGGWQAASNVKGLFREATAADPPKTDIPIAKPVSPPPSVAGGGQLPDAAPKKAAPDLPSGLDSLVVGGKKPSPKKPAETRPPEAKPQPAAPQAEAPPAEAVPPAEEPAANPFASDSAAAQQPHRKGRGGLGSLFSFDTMIAPTVIKILFYVTTTLVLLGWLLMSLGLITRVVLSGGGAVSWVMAGVQSLFSLVMAMMIIVVYRVIAESVITFFQIREDVRDIRELMEEKSGVID